MGDFGLNQTFEYTELCLDSWDAKSSGGQYFENSSSNPNLIQYSWPQYYFNSKKPEVIGIKVLQAEIPFVWDAITLGNNTFVYTTAGVPHTLTITPGTYTGPQLATELQAKINAFTAALTVTWSASALKFLFTYPLASTWSLYFADRNSAYSPVGFLPGVLYQNVGIGSTIQSAIIAQVTGPYYLYVNSSKIGSLVNFNLCDTAITGGVGPEIARIPVNVQFGSVVFYTDPDPNKYFDFFTGTQFDSFDFYLTLGSDQYQKPLDLKGSPWSLKLGVLSYRKASSDLYQKPVTRGGQTTISM